MPNGSNQYTKNLVQAGALCSVCEQVVPTLVDDVGGPICAPCHTHMQTGLLQHALKDGYRVQTRKVTSV